MSASSYTGSASPARSASPSRRWSGAGSSDTSHIDPTWIGINAVDFFSKVTGRLTVLNDADAAGIAEVRFGAGRA